MYIYCWVTFSADVILKYFPFFQKAGFKILCKLSPKASLQEYQTFLFLGKKKNIIILSSAELAQIAANVKLVNPCHDE